MTNFSPILVTCEHAGNRVPVRYLHLFRHSPRVLSTHRALDIGALILAKRIAFLLQAPLFSCSATRLLIDANRSIGNRAVFSEFSRSLPVNEKERLIRGVYRGYRNRVESWIREHAGPKATVLHLSIHSFTPVLRGKIRNADIGILYDPHRKAEKELSRSLQLKLRKHTGMRIRCNYPYRGSSDGFTTALRKMYDPPEYLGLEIEFNQSMLSSGKRKNSELAEFFCSALPCGYGKLQKKTGE